MKLSTRIRPISYLKSNAAKIVSELGQSQEAMIITQNGEATAVIQDVKSYEQTQETLSLLKILALGNRQIEEKKVQPADKVFRNIRKNRNKPG